MLHFQTSNSLSNRSISLCCRAFRKLWVFFFLKTLEMCWEESGKHRASVVQTWQLP